MDDTLNIQKIEAYIDSIVAPIRASKRRKDKMREELLAHLQAIHFEEVSRTDDPQAAFEKATTRFGEIDNIRNELEKNVSILEKFVNAKLVDWLDDDLKHFLSIENGRNMFSRHTLHFTFRMLLFYIILSLCGACGSLTSGYLFSHEKVNLITVAIFVLVLAPIVATLDTIILLRMTINDIRNLPRCANPLKLSARDVPKLLLFIIIYVLANSIVLTLPAVLAGLSPQYMNGLVVPLIAPLCIIALITEHLIKSVMRE